MRRHYLILLVLVALPFGTLLTVNLIDYAQFQFAIRRVETISNAEIRSLADYCRQVEKPLRFEGSNAPTALQPLKPINGTLYPGSCDALLYELGDISLWVRISTSALNQEIAYFTNASGRQHKKIIWSRNPEYARQLNPLNRIITVRVSWMLSRTLEWIVLPDRLMVIERAHTTGSDDTILAKGPLTNTALASIKSALNEIGLSVRGKHYTSGASDGIHLHLNLGTDGENTPDDIIIENAWIEAIGPLLRTISKIAPKEHPIAFEQIMQQSDLANRPITVMPLADWEARYYGQPKTPWWCVWRLIVQTKDN